MLRVVLDTNVYVSAFAFGGVPLDVVRLAIRGEIAVFLSPPILREVEGVFLHKFRWPRPRVARLLRAIRAFARSVSPSERIHVLEDDADNRILECARSARAHVIVTGDRPLRRLEAFHHARILHPREFLGIYRSLGRQG